MECSHPSSSFRRALAASLLLGVVLFTSGPARAASITVFWDREDFGYGAGYGVRQTTAQAASSAGIPTVQVSSLDPWNSTLLPIDRMLDDASLNPAFPTGSTPATITSSWTATNDGAGANQNLYLVFERPITNDQFYVNGQQQLVTYDPADVGLLLSNDGNGPAIDWVILQVPVDASTNVYYPAVSLGPLANGAAATYPLFYTLQNPQVFTENFNYKLGIPEWGLAFLSTAAPIPEPTSGVLFLVGLLGIAGCGRRKQP
jgi:hypothetical protein